MVLQSAGGSKYWDSERERERENILTEVHLSSISC